MPPNKLENTKKIIKIEFDRKREELLREKQLDLALTKRHQGVDLSIKGDMKPTVKRIRKKLLRSRQSGLIK
jgi:hypothetical protein